MGLCHNRICVSRSSQQRQFAANKEVGLLLLLVGHTGTQCPFCRSQRSSMLTPWSSSVTMTRAFRCCFPALSRNYLMVWQPNKKADMPRHICSSNTYRDPSLQLFLAPKNPTVTDHTFSGSRSSSISPLLHQDHHGLQQQSPPAIAGGIGASFDLRQQRCLRTWQEPLRQPSRTASNANLGFEPSASVEHQFLKLR